ncbi:MAG: sulfite exporter TauE/SafE family protein [Burkholderiales bacterium]
MDWLYPLSGLVVGMIVGLTGVGGGSLMTPLLMLVFGIAPAVAVGTDLLYAAFTKMGGSVAHHNRGTVNWNIVGWLAVGSVPASIVTTMFLHWLGVDANKFNALIKFSLGIALILTAAAIIFRGKLAQYAKHDAEEKPGWREHHLVSVTVLTGVALGVLVTISSIGAGALGTVALFFLYPKLKPVQIVGTDIAHAVPLTLVAGLGHAALGTVNWVLLASLLVGSLPGIWIGSHLSSRVPEKWLRTALATMLLVIGGKFVF